MGTESTTNTANTAIVSPRPIEGIESTSQPLTTPNSLTSSLAADGKVEEKAALASVTGEQQEVAIGNAAQYRPTRHNEVPTSYILIAGTLFLAGFLLLAFGMTIVKNFGLNVNYGLAGLGGLLIIFMPILSSQFNNYNAKGTSSSRYIQKIMELSKSELTLTILFFALGPIIISFIGFLPKLGIETAGNIGLGFNLSISNFLLILGAVIFITTFMIHGLRTSLTSKRGKIHANRATGLLIVCLMLLATTLPLSILKVGAFSTALTNMSFFANLGSLVVTMNVAVLFLALVIFAVTRTVGNAEYWEELSFKSSVLDNLSVQTQSTPTDLTDQIILLHNATKIFLLAIDQFIEHSIEYRNKYQVAGENNPTERLTGLEEKIETARATLNETHQVAQNHFAGLIQISEKYKSAGLPSEVNTALEACADAKLKISAFDLESLILDIRANSANPSYQESLLKLAQELADEMQSELDYIPTYSFANPSLLSTHTRLLVNLSSKEAINKVLENWRALLDERLFSANASTAPISLSLASETLTPLFSQSPSTTTIARGPGLFETIENAPLTSPSAIVSAHSSVPTAPRHDA